MNQHWRPTLGMVLGGALAGTLALSFAGLVALRILGPMIGFRNAAFLLALTITLATAVLGLLMMRLLLRPIRALEAYALAQERGAAPAPPRHFGTQELLATGTRVIAMADALRDREATIRAFTDHVIHELRTPVSAIRAATELLQDGGTLSPGDAGLLTQIDGARVQIEAQLAALREAAQARETRHLGRSTLADLLPQMHADWPGLTLMVQGETLPLPIAAQGLSIVLRQVLRNATEHGASRVTLRSSQAETGPRLEIADDGMGISAGNAARIFDPFFTTRRAEDGTGMGLTVVRNLLHAHRADITLVPAAQGAEFRIDFAPTE